MQSLRLDFRQSMQTSLPVGVKKRFNPTLTRSWQRDVRVALQRQSPPGTDRVTLCAQRSQNESYLFQQTHHNKQTQAQSLRHSQILLYLCLALQSPTYSDYPHRASIGGPLLFFTGNFHRILNSEINYCLFLNRSK